ncbi:hypothetical protein FQZ97_410460 [compost metagenome]
MLVAEGVVDLLEAVHVQQQHGEQALRRVGDALLEVAHQPVAVGQAGQRVVAGQVLLLGEVALALGDVVQHQQDQAVLPPVEQRGAHLAVERLAVVLAEELPFGVVPGDLGVEQCVQRGAAADLRQAAIGLALRGQLRGQPAVQHLGLGHPEQFSGAAVGGLDPAVLGEQQHAVVDVGEQAPIELLALAELTDQTAQLPGRQPHRQQAEDQQRERENTAAQPGQLVAGGGLADHGEKRKAFRRGDRVQRALTVDAAPLDYLEALLVEQRADRRVAGQRLAGEAFGLRHAIKHDAVAVDHAGVHVRLQPHALQQLTEAPGGDQRAGLQGRALPGAHLDCQRQQVMGPVLEAERPAEQRPAVGAAGEGRELLQQGLGEHRLAPGVDDIQAVAAAGEQVRRDRVVAHRLGEHPVGGGGVRGRLVEFLGDHPGTFVALLQQGADVAFEGPRQGGDVLAHLVVGHPVVAVQAPATQADRQQQHQQHAGMERQADALPRQGRAGMGEGVEDTGHGGPPVAAGRSQA